VTISSGESGTGAIVVAAVSFAAWQSALGAQASALAARIIATTRMLHSKEEKRGVQNREIGRRVIAPPHAKIIRFGTSAEILAQNPRILQEFSVAWPFSCHQRFS
jgi:hypothetical protein